MTPIVKMLIRYELYVQIITCPWFAEQQIGILVAVKIHMVIQEYPESTSALWTQLDSYIIYRCNDTATKVEFAFPARC